MKQQISPFPYFRVVTGDDFADREQETADLLLSARNRERVFLVSPRRFGKTSLITNLLEKVRQRGILAASIDVSSVTSLDKLLNQLVSAVLHEAEKTLDKVGRAVRELLPRFRPSITMNQDGTPTVSLELGSTTPRLDDLTDVLGLAETIAKKRQKTFLIVWDEFQGILNLDGPGLESALRSIIQHQKQTSYIFCGSEPTILTDMVANPDRPFYKMGRLYELKKIPRPVFAAYLLDKFRATGYKIEAFVMEKVLDLVDDYPFNAQLLCSELWNYCNKGGGQLRVTSEDVDVCLERTLGAFRLVFAPLTEELTLIQRRLLRAIAQTGGTTGLHAEALRQAYQLGPSSTVSNTIKALWSKRLLVPDEQKGYAFADPFFKHWILQKLK